MNLPAFATAEGLRLLLLDLAYAGPGAWQTSPDAAELMTYTMDKYAGLANKYGVEPIDAAAIAQSRKGKAVDVVTAAVADRLKTLKTEMEARY